LFLYDVDSGKVIEEIPGEAYVAAISPSGDRLAVVFHDPHKDPQTSKFEISIIENHKVVRILTQIGWISDLVFLNDKDRIASGSVDKKIRVWDLGLSPAEPVVLDHDNPIDSVSWACGRLFSSDGSVHEFNIQANERRRIGSGVNPVVSPGCSKIAAIDNNSVAVWDLQTGRELSRFLVHDEKKLQYVDFLDDETVLSLGEDGFVKVYSLDREKWLSTGGDFLANRSAH
jgi:WD40 repeat protein